ncbi:ABC transporter substrate-binding protein [Jiella sp. M17.18]|uniref:ABC transporter substrate-binding protein n=1 Tax=Jiella sp. M17.18 TaxID=3234247 RepID=UPI0034DFD414
MTRSLRRGLAAGLLAAAVGLSATAAQAADKITVGALRLASHAPTFIAVERGYFKDEGLDVNLAFFEAAQPVAVAIASGDVDFGITAITGGLINLAQKGAVKVVGGALEEQPGIKGEEILVSKKAYDAGVTSPDKLAGHSFGITQPGSSFHYMISKIAEKSGFDLKSMRLVPLQKVGALIAALKSGQIDAWTIVPNIAEMLTKGGEVKSIGQVADYIPNYQVTTVFTSSGNAADKKDIVKRFLKAFSHGVADYNAALVDKTASAAETKAVTQIIAKYAYPNRDYATAAAAIQGGAMRLSPDAALNLSSVKDQLDWFKSEKLVPASASLDTLVDKSFVETK